MTDRDPGPDRYEPDDPREWLRLARLDLAFASTSIAGTQAFELHSYHAQQAAEKALKAVCLARGIVFPFTHRIARLLRILSADGAAIPEPLRAAAHLTRYATAGRYPRLSNIDADALEAAASAASNVVAWAETQIAGAGGVREKPLRRYPDELRGQSDPAPPLLADIVARIVAVAAPERIILFGSGARGTLRPDSDLDLMIVTTHED
ncbi:MAG: HEPN domain-containing protein, partial [Longimicrobiales bacterium]